MVRIAIALAAIPLVLLAACGGGESSAAPKDWKPMPGASDAWSNGVGSGVQEYHYRAQALRGRRFQDLASTVTIDALLRHRGAKSSGNLPFAACPGLAGVASFALSDGEAAARGLYRSQRDLVANQLLAPRGHAGRSQRGSSHAEGSLQPPLNDSGLITGPGSALRRLRPVGGRQRHPRRGAPGSAAQSAVLGLGDDPFAQAGGANGEHYFFVSNGEFAELLRSGGLLESREYNGNLYGTPRDYVEGSLTQGYDVIMKPEVNGALAVKAAYP